METKVLTKIEYGALMMFLAVTITTASVPLSFLAADLFTKSIAHSLSSQVQDTTNNFSLHDMLSLFQGRDIAIFVLVLVLLIPFGIMYSTSRIVVKKNQILGFWLLSRKSYEILWTIPFAISLAFFASAAFDFHQTSLDSNSLAGFYMILDGGFLFLISSGLCLSGLFLYDKKPFYSQSLFWSAIMIIVLWIFTTLSNMQL